MSLLPPQATDVERRLLLQYVISRALAEAETVEDAVAHLLAEIGRALDRRLGALWLVDESGSALRSAAVWTREEADSGFNEATQSLTFKRGEGIPGQVWDGGQPYWVSDVNALPALPRHELIRRQGLHAVFAFPIMIIEGQKQRVLGVVEFYSDHTEPPDESLLREAQGIGFQIGGFIERIRALEAERLSRVRNAAVVDVALDSVITINHEGRVLEWNAAAEQTFGYTRDKVFGRQLGELIVPPGQREAHYRGMERYLRTNEPHILGRRVELEAMRADGSTFPVEIAITRVPIPGPPVFTSYLRDLTERKRREAHQQLLVQASTVLTSSLDYEQTLRNLSAVVIPAFADWYAVDVVAEDGTVKRLEVAHRDPTKAQLARELAERYPPAPDERRGVREVLRTGHGEFGASIPDELLQSISRGEEHLRLLRELGLRSYMIVPLRNRAQIFGAITFVTAESGRRYDADDLAIAEDLALRASQAIENARLFREVEESRELLEQQATELEQQAEEVEHAAAELQESNEALQRTNDELAKRSYEAERARREAEASRSEALEANRAKSDFLASMSHELRTPLNAIMGYAQLMEIGVHGAVSQPQREDLNRIDRSAQHLLGLINDILNFAKIERGSVSYNLERVAIADVLAGVEDLVGPQARAKQLEYRFRNDCSGTLVCGDREKLMQIFVNLLSNAVHFTAEGGSIEIACSATADRVVTRVIDTGVGIPHDKLDAIFEPFVQVERVYSGQRTGTGLGLAISRALARGMGGDLTVTSELGKGSEFALTLKRET